MTPTDTTQQVRPFDAYEGGAKVLAAIKEVLRYNGPLEKAIDAGERALLDLRRTLAETARPDPSLSDRELLAREYEAEQMHLASEPNEYGSGFFARRDQAALRAIASARLQVAQEERERIVAWLPSRKSVPIMDPPWSAAWNACLKHIADAIERGEWERKDD